MLLIYPPLVKPSEPPPGIAKLLGACKAHGVPCRVLDANLEGILYLLARGEVQDDKWGRRAVKNAERNVAALRDPATYRSPDRYRRAVMDLNKVLGMAGKAMGAHVGLANYRDDRLSPVRSADLTKAAEEPEGNPFYPYFKDRLRALFEEEAPPLIGFSLNFLSQALSVFAMIGYVKKEHPQARVVLGGGLITSWMRRPDWQDPFGGLVDHLVAGPGEEALLSLAGLEPPYHRAAEPPLSCPPSQGADVDSCPEAELRGDHITPDYGTLPMGAYLSPGTILPYSASTGCYWNKCAFCPEQAERNPYLKIADEAVIRDLWRLTEGVKPALIHITDNAISPSLMKALMKSPPGAPWYGFARITERLTDLDFCLALKQSGCVILKLGLESGDQGVLDAMRKGTDLNTASKALKTLKQAGIAVYVYLLFGTPSETEEAARRTLFFVSAHDEMIDFLNVAIFNLPISGPEAGILDTEPFYEGDLSLYRDFVHPSGWDRRRVRAFLDREFKRARSIAAIIRRDPPLFTSNHAPFFCY